MSAPDDETVPPAVPTSLKDRFMRIPHTDRDAAELWDDDRRLAWWVRLRMAFDQSFPAMAELPRVPDDVLAVLVQAGEVEVSGLRYRCPSIIAEREPRQASAVANANKRWERHRAAQAAKADAGAHAPADAGAHANDDANPMLRNESNEQQRNELQRAETSPGAAIEIRPGTQPTGPVEQPSIAAPGGRSSAKREPRRGSMSHVSDDVRAFAEQRLADPLTPDWERVEHERTLAQLASLNGAAR